MLSFGGLNTFGSVGGGSATWTGTVTALGFVSTQASGSNAFLINTAGARLKLSSGGTTDYLTSDGATTITAAGSFTVADVFTISGGLHTNTGSPNVLRNSTTALINMAAAGNMEISAVSGNRIRLQSPTQIDDNFIFNSFTDDSATTGNRTVNTMRGINAFAGAATAITITNSFVTATSMVACELQTNDATARIANVVPASGSFTINLSAAATGTTKVGWVVLN